MDRYGKKNTEIKHTSVSIRKEVLIAIYDYMSDRNMRNRSEALEKLAEERLIELGYMQGIDSKDI